MNINAVKKIRIYPDTHMSLGHVGLEAKALHLDKLNALVEDELYIFINRPRTSFKVLSSDGKMTGHYRSGSTRPISVDAIIYFPHYYGGDVGAAYLKALDHSIRLKCPYLLPEELKKETASKKVTIPKTKNKFKSIKTKNKFKIIKNKGKK